MSPKFSLSRWTCALAVAVVFVCLPSIVPAGTIVGWGDDLWGQISAIPAGDDFTAISAGSLFGLALRSDGSLEGWGISWHNVTLVPPGNDFIAVAAGGMHALALRQDGSIVAWGDNSHGECTPPTGGGFVAIAAGTGTSFALHGGGWVVAWGKSADFPTGSYAEIDCDVYTDARLALRSDGSIVQAGSDLTPPPTGGGFSAIAAGHGHGVALRGNGSLVAWGSPAPPSGNDFIAIAAANFDAALRTDGTLVAWHGDDEYGELDVPAGGGFEALSVGVSFGLALTVSSTSPVIRWHPQGCAAVIGDRVEFHVLATGAAPLTYQWRKDGVALSDFGDVSGATTADLTLLSVQTDEAGSYDVIVTNNHGSATSHAAPLTVGPCLPPVIGADPTGGEIAEGSTLSLAVVASGIQPLYYQWRQDGRNLADGGRYSGTTAANLRIAPVHGDDAGRYDVLVSNRCGSVTSGPANITIASCEPPQIVLPPTDRNVNERDAVILTVTATGVAPLAYQWRKDGANLTDRDGYAGTHTAQLTIAAATLQQDGDYDVVVSSTCGNAISSPAKVSVCAPPVIDLHPVSRGVVAGSSITFTVVVRGSEPFAFGWRKDGIALVDNAHVAGVSTHALTIQAVQQTDVGSYDVVVTNSCGGATSRTGRLTIKLAATSPDDAPASVAAAAPAQSEDTTPTGDIAVVPATFESAPADEAQPEESASRIGGLCGAGSLGAVPLALMGICGMKARVRSRVRCARPS